MRFGTNKMRSGDDDNHWLFLISHCTVTVSLANRKHLLSLSDAVVSRVSDAAVKANGNATVNYFTYISHGRNRLRPALLERTCLNDDFLFRFRHILHDEFRC